METQYGIGYRGLHDYRSKHLAKRLASSRQKTEKSTQHTALEHEKKDTQDADFTVDAVNSVISKVRKMLDSADEALQDPDNPDRYFLGPSAAEIEVVYTETVDGESVKRKCSLQNMLDRIEVDGRQIGARSVSGK